MEIRHNESEHKFFINIEGEECGLKYSELSEKLWNFESTYVPDTFLERGFIEEMIEYAINFVKEHNIKILASCEDVQDFLVRHKDLKSLVYHPY
jgi:uncharacterized protein